MHTHSTTCDPPERICNSIWPVRMCHTLIFFVLLSRSHRVRTYAFVTFYAAFMLHAFHFMFIICGEWFCNKCWNKRARTLVFNSFLLLSVSHLARFSSTLLFFITSEWISIIIVIVYFVCALVIHWVRVWCNTKHSTTLQTQAATQNKTKQSRRWMCVCVGLRVWITPTRLKRTYSAYRIWHETRCTRPQRIYLFNSDSDSDIFHVRAVVLLFLDAGCRQNARTRFLRVRLIRWHACDRWWSVASLGRFKYTTLTFTITNRACGCGRSRLDLIETPWPCGTQEYRLRSTTRFNQKSEMNMKKLRQHNNNSLRLSFLAFPIESVCVYLTEWISISFI